jgi:hypothetical protein
MALLAAKVAYELNIHASSGRITTRSASAQPTQRIPSVVCEHVKPTVFMNHEFLLMSHKLMQQHLLTEKLEYVQQDAA